MLEPGWVRANHDAFDVFHVHFGFDAVTPDHLEEVIALLRHYRKPLVYTAHDLRNPHQSDAGVHLALLDLLVPAADAVITLTPGAREEIGQRWDREAVVLPHPHVVPRERLEAPRPGSGFVIGVHAKSLRANMDPLPVICALADQVSDWPEAVLRVDVHDEIFDRDNYWYAPETGRQIVDLGRAPQVDLRVHHYFSDNELWAYLAAIDVSVLPYRFGTHSGWLEACHDVGTGIVVPDCGFYAEQRPAEVYAVGEHRDLDRDSLVKAVEALRHNPPARPSWQSRWAERRWLATEHAAIYQALLR